MAPSRTIRAGVGSPGPDEIMKMVRAEAGSAARQELRRLLGSSSLANELAPDAVPQRAVSTPTTETWPSEDGAREGDEVYLLVPGDDPVLLRFSQSRPRGSRWQMVGAAAATADPLMDGTASVGTSGKWAREDHRHPVDTSRASQSDFASLRAVMENSTHPVPLHSAGPFGSVSITGGWQFLGVYHVSIPPAPAGKAWWVRFRVTGVWFSWGAYGNCTVRCEVPGGSLDAGQSFPAADAYMQANSAWRYVGPSGGQWDHQMYQVTNRGGGTSTQMHIHGVYWQGHLV